MIELHPIAAQLQGNKKAIRYVAQFGPLNDNEDLGFGKYVDPELDKMNRE
jgi:hypothetical protein